MGCFQSLYILTAVWSFNSSQHITVLQQSGIHQKTGNTAVSIYKGMNKYKLFVQQCSKLYRMVIRSGFLYLMKKLLHLLPDCIGRADRILGARYHHRLCSVLPCSVFINMAVKHTVKVQSIIFRNSP